MANIFVQSDAVNLKFFVISKSSKSTYAFVFGSLSILDSWGLFTEAQNAPWLHLWGYLTFGLPALDSNRLLI